MGRYAYEGWLEDDHDHPVSEEFLESPPETLPHVLTREEQRRGGKASLTTMTREQRRTRAQKAGRARGKK